MKLGVSIRTKVYLFDELGVSIRRIDTHLLQIIKKNVRNQKTAPYNLQVHSRTRSI